MDANGGFRHEFEPNLDPPQHLDDGQKSMLLGTHLLAACLTLDPDAGIYEAEDGDIIGVLVLDNDKLDYARAAFLRESMKMKDDDHTELFVGWHDDGKGHTFVQFNVQNPADLAGYDQFSKKSIPELPEEGG